VELAAVAGPCQVREHRTADGTARADQHDRRRSQHRRDRRHRRVALARLEPPPPLRRGRRRKPHVQLAGLRAHLDRIAGRAEHPDHAVVARHRERLEHVDAVLGGRAREVREQRRGQPSPLPCAVDGERDLRGVGPGPLVERVADGPLGRAGQHEQREPVLRRHRLDRGALEVDARGEEAEPARLRLQPFQQLAHERRVVGAGRADARRRAVAQHDVDLRDRAHGRTLLRSAKP
jgi:hypothetical protein